MTSPAAKGKDTPDEVPPAVPGGNAGEVRTDIDPDAAPEDPALWGVHYSRAGQVRQALAELRNARGQGNTTREHAALKTLHSLGYNPQTSTAGDKPGDKSADARRQAPEGRSSTPPAAKVTTAGGPAGGVSATSTVPAPAAAPSPTAPSPTAGPVSPPAPPSKPVSK